MPAFKIRYLIFVPFWSYSEVEADNVDEAVSEWENLDLQVPADMRIITDNGELYAPVPEPDIDYDSAEIELNGKFVPIYEE